MREFWQLLAEANRYINRTWLDAMETVPFAELDRERGAFFGSLFGTWNHLLLGDRVWLARIAARPHGFRALDQRIADDLDTFRSEREHTDAQLISLVTSVPDFDQPVRYKNRDGAQCDWPLHQALAHLFAHQQHHRGQISQMCHESGIEIPDGGLSPYFRSTGHPM